MKRQLTGAIVDRLKNEKTKREAVIRLDKRSMTFFCKIGDVTRQDKDGGVVKAWASMELEKATDEFLLKWIPVIEATIDAGDNSGMRYRGGEGNTEGVKFDVDRYYVAKAKDEPYGETWVRLAWEQCNPDSPGRLDERDMYSRSSSFVTPRGVPYERPDEGRRTIFRLPSINWPDHRRYYLPYSPELWAASMQILAVIKDARETVQRLFGTKDGQAHLLAVGAGAKLLLSGGAKATIADATEET